MPAPTAVLSRGAPPGSAAIAASLVVLALLGVLALLASLGVELAAPAGAVTTDNIAVTATVGSALVVSDTCSSAIGISVIMSNYTHGSCVVEFGSVNDATTTLRLGSTAGNFLSGGFTDHAGACTALAGTTVGYKVSAVGAGTATATGCAVTADTANTDYRGVPDAASGICTSSTLGNTHPCTVTVGINEATGSTAAGNYTGTLSFDVIG